MAKGDMVKFSGQISRQAQKDLVAYVKASGQKLSTVYGEMVELYLRTKRVRPEVMTAARRIMAEDAELLERLAK